MQISIAILVGNANQGISYVKRLVRNFKARVLSYPNSIFEAEPCLVATLTELNDIELLRQTSLIVTPNAYNEGVLYDVVPNTPLGDMDVVRATTATRVNSAGLIEVVPYNLLEQSQTFQNATFWGVSEVSISSNVATAPDGTMTADKLVESSANSLHEIYTNNPYSLIAGSNYTKSVYAKSAERTQIALNFVTGGFGQGSQVIANLTNGTLGTITNYGGITESSATITNVGNSWYRISLTIKPVTTQDFYVDFAPVLNGNPIYQGNGTSGVFIWGAQLEVGSILKEYFPTTTRLNIPRIDYSTGSAALLVEPQRTNLFVNSNDIIGVSGGTVNSNVFTSPDGTQNSDQFIVSTANTYHTGVRDIVGSASTNYNVSLFVKAGTGRYFLFRAMTNSYVTRFGITVDLQTGTILQTDSVGSPTNTSAKIENYGDGWYRLSLTMASIGTQYGSIWSASNVANPPLDAFLDYTYIGNGTDSYYIWGFQMEAGTYPTSYIPTLASTVTRNADVISRTGISSLIGQTEGTMFVDVINSKTILDTIVISLSDGTFSNYLQLSTNSITGNLQSVIFTGGGATALGTIITNVNQRYKVAIAYKLNDYALYINGTQIGTLTSKAAPSSLTRLDISGLSWAAEGYIYSNPYNSAQLYKTRLSNSELASLTSL
jgi:hypothetical protein